MRAVRFPYLKYKGALCPLVMVAIQGPKDWAGILAYVDSGASYSILSTKVAEEMGLAYEDGQLQYVTVGDGSAIPLYLPRLPIRIGSYEFTATIGFSPRLGIGFNLLGRQDIFGHFDVTFSDTRGVVVFQPVRSLLPIRQRARGTR